MLIESTMNQPCHLFSLKAMNIQSVGYLEGFGNLIHLQKGHLEKHPANCVSFCYLSSSFPESMRCGNYDYPIILAMGGNSGSKRLQALSHKGGIDLILSLLETLQFILVYHSGLVTILHKSNYQNRAPSK